MTVGLFIVGFTRLLSTTYENNCYHDAHQKDSFPTDVTVFQLDNLLVCQQSHNTAIFVMPHAKTRLFSTILQNHFITDSNREDTQL